MAKRTTLDAWIQQAMNDPDKDHRCTQITLIHMQGAMQGKELHSVKIKEGGTYEPKNMATLFRNRAETYSQDLPGVQTFNLVAFYGKTEPEAHQPFLVNIQTDHHASGLSTEGPSAEGQTQQRMRHTEMLMQQVYRRQESMDARSDRLMDMMSRHIERLQAENMEAFNGVKSMMMQMTLNREESEMKRLAYIRNTEVAGKLVGMAPPLVNMIAGREVFPQSAVDTAIMEGLVLGADPEMLKSMLPLLPEAVQGLVAQRMSQILQKKAEDDKRRSELPVYKGSPIEELNGGTAPAMTQTSNEDE